MEALPVLRCHGAEVVGGGVWLEVCGDSPHAGEGSDAAGFSHGGSSAHRKVSFFTQRDTTCAPEVTRIYLLRISTRPKDYVQTHPRCFFFTEKVLDMTAVFGKSLLLQRVIEDENFGCHSGSLI